MANPAASLAAATGWERAIEPGRADGRLVAESVEAARTADTVELPTALAPELAAALPASGIEALYSHQLEALEAVAGGNAIVTSGTASGKSLSFNLPVLDQLVRDDGHRALYLYPAKALAQDQARKLSALGLPQLRHAIYDGDTPRDDRPQIRRRSNLILTNPDMLHVGILPHHKSWGDFLASLGWVVVDEAHTYRGVFGSHVANVLRRLRRVAGLYGASPRFILASATIANPVELAERLVGEPFRLVDSDGAPRARRRIGIWNPPVIDPQVDDAALGPLRGRRAARRPGRRGGADDLLPAQPARDRVDPAVCAHQARGAGSPAARRADRPLPGRLHAPAAPRDRGSAGGRRAARGRRHRRARAGHRHRGAGRGDLRHLPRHGREPAADVGAGGQAQRGTRPVHRRRGRAGPVLLPPSGGVPGAAGGGRDPRSRERADPARPPAGRGLRGAAVGCRRRGVRRAVAGASRRPGGDRRAAARSRGPLPATRPALSGRRHLAALGVAGLGGDRRAELRRAPGRGRGRARLHHRPSRRRLPAPGALVRGARARHRGATRGGRSLRRRLVHAAEEGDGSVHRADRRQERRSGRAEGRGSSCSSARCPSPSR